MKKKTIIIKYNHCNLRCTYCYEWSRDTLNHQDIEVGECVNRIKTFLEFVSKCCKNNKDCSFLLLIHGGEPLCAPEKLLESLADVVTRHPESLTFAIQSNLTVLSRKQVEKLSTLFRNKMQGERGVGVSIDGPPDVNDPLRPTINGAPSTGMVMRNLRRLREAGISASFLTVVSRMNLKEAEKIFEFIVSRKPRFWRIIPCYDLTDEGELAPYSIRPNEYYRFVFQIFELLLKHRLLGKISVDPIMSATACLLGKPTPFCEYSENKCENFITLNPDETVSLCDSWRGDRGVSIGPWKLKQAEELFLRKGTTPEYERRRKILMSKCEACKSYSVCVGGCLARRWEFIQTAPDVYREYCESRVWFSEQLRGVIDEATRSDINSH